jgi:SAM-dependent methyltransferase
MDRTEMSGVAQAEKHAVVFRRLLPLQILLKEVMRMAGRTEGLSCMDFGASNCMLSYHLRKGGGQWRTVIVHQDDLDAFVAGLGAEVTVFDGGRMPLENKVFNRIVILDGMTGGDSDAALIEECHRCLRPDGQLILHVRRANRWSPLGLVRKVVGRPKQQGSRHDSWPGYTETELFRVLKDGFDVHQVRPFGKFFLTLTELLTSRFTRVWGSDSGLVMERQSKRRLAIIGLAYRLAYQLDMFLFMTRGHRLLVMAKRRAWRPRETPVLVDGRSISEAVLSRALR